VGKQPEHGSLEQPEHGSLEPRVRAIVDRVEIVEIVEPLSARARVAPDAWRSNTRSSCCSPIGEVLPEDSLKYSVSA